ncbi:MAG: hypothetical protein WC637_00200 [Victivallales bacterium]
MSEIQRYDFHGSLYNGVEEDSAGDYVLYTDHLAALAEKDKIINVFTYLLLHHGIISRGKASAVVEIDRAEIDGWMEKMAVEWRKEAV